jgi:hypothetical protein
MIDYYLPVKSDKLTIRQHINLRALDANHPLYHKYQVEYKVHCWIPPLEILPPRDYSIGNDWL